MKLLVEATYTPEEKSAINAVLKVIKKGGFYFKDITTKYPNPCIIDGSFYYIKCECTFGRQGLVKIDYNRAFKSFILKIDNEDYSNWLDYHNVSDVIKIMTKGKNILSELEDLRKNGTLDKLPKVN